MTDDRHKARETTKAYLERQRAARRAATRDPHAREQAKTETETEERPYLDTEGGE